MPQRFSTPTDFLTPNMVNVVYRTGPDVTDVAATGGGVMTVNSAWCRKHPEDTGLTVHEMAHVVQSMSAYNPVWLIEGVADYIRWIKFEPRKLPCAHQRAHRDLSRLVPYHRDLSGMVRTALRQPAGHPPQSRCAVRQVYGRRGSNSTAAKMSIRSGRSLSRPIRPIPTISSRRRSPLPTGLARCPTVQPGSSVAVDLATAFNTTGFTKDGERLHGDGRFRWRRRGLLRDSARRAPLPARASRSNLDRRTLADVVSCKGGTVSLPAGSYASLWLLGSAVEGNQMAQPLTVTYTDGTTETLSQNFSDWFLPQGFPGESRAVKMAYRNLPTGGKDGRPFYVYSYGFQLDHTKTVKSLTLPNNPNVKILAISLAN